MKAELARIEQVRHGPAVEVVFGHALLGEALEAGGVAGGVGAEQGGTAELLRRAAIVDLVELVAAAELAGDGIPEELHQLHPRLAGIAVRAAHIAVEIGAELGIGEITCMRIEVDEPG